MTSEYSYAELHKSLCPARQKAMAKTSQKPFLLKKITTGQTVTSHNLAKDNSTYRRLALLHCIAFFLFNFFSLLLTRLVSVLPVTSQEQFE